MEWAGRGSLNETSGLNNTPDSQAMFAATTKKSWLLTNINDTGTVTLIEMCSSAVGFSAVAMDQCGVVGFSGGGVERGNLTPDCQAFSHLGSPSVGAEQMPSRPKVCGDAAKG